MHLDETALARVPLLHEFNALRLEGGKASLFKFADQLYECQ
jgi:hypothetical protein